MPFRFALAARKLTTALPMPRPRYSAAPITIGISCTENVTSPTGRNSRFFCFNKIQLTVNVQIIIHPVQFFRSIRFTNAVNKEHEFRVRIPFKCKIAFARVPPQSEFGRYIKNSFVRTALHHFQSLPFGFLCFIIHSPPLKSKQIGRIAFAVRPKSSCLIAVFQFKVRCLRFNSHHEQTFDP